MSILSAFLVHDEADPRAEAILAELGRFGISDLRFGGAHPVLDQATIVVDAGGPRDQLEYARALDKPIVSVDPGGPAIEVAREITLAAIRHVPRGPLGFFLDQRGEGQRPPVLPAAFSLFPTFVIRPDRAARGRDTSHAPDAVSETIYRVRETVALLREVPSALREVHLAGNAQPGFLAALGGLFQRTDGTRRIVHGPSGEWSDEPHLPFIPAFPRRPVLVSARPGRDHLLYVGSELYLEDAILEGRRRGLSVSYLGTRPTGGDWVKSLLDGIEAFVAERPDPRARLSLVWTAPPPLLALAAGRLAEAICPSWGILEPDPASGRYVDHHVASLGTPLRAWRRSTLPPMAGEARSA